jgi:hypothetical protein
VEDQPVVEAVGSELAEVLDRLRRVLVEELDRDLPGAGVKGRGGDGGNPIGTPATLLAWRGDAVLNVDGSATVGSGSCCG